MGKYRHSGKVIIGGTEFATDAPIVNFRDPPYWDATKQVCIPTDTDPVPQTQCTLQDNGRWVPYGKLPFPYTTRYKTRHALSLPKWKNGEAAPYEAAKDVIKHFVIHHDGCASADMCFSVLQNERGLSCHFLVDNDGTIFQTLDLALEGFHAAEWNPTSIGVELCNRGDAHKEPTYYSRKGQSRDIKPCKINNHTILSYEFTPEQYESMQRLSRALLRLLPNLPAEYPQSSPGVQSWETLPFRSLSSFSGYIGHYHLTNQKWDPGPFDFKKYCQAIRGSFCFPLFPRGKPDANQQLPAMPQQISQVKVDAELLYQFNEARADGGYFPVGPWGDSRLWHGGLHMATPEGGKVFSPFPGRVVAARFGAPSAAGSVNFVLVFHAIALADKKLEFHALYMHLDDPKGDPPEWLVKARVDKKTGQPRKLPPGEVWLLDEALEAGSVIGQVGVAGPSDLARGQVHLEMFSASDLFEGMKASPWEVIDGSGSGRFCDAPRILEIIDGDRDNVLTREELRQFYSSGGGAALRYFVTRHVSEWIAEPSWSEALRLPKDFRKWKPEQIDQLVAEQITPTLWWDEKVATHARLPPDGVVYHYNPISFIAFVNEKLIEAGANTEVAVSLKDAKGVPPGITDDFGDKEGTTMRSTSEFKTDPCNEKLTLKELVMGFDAPECP